MFFAGPGSWWESGDSHGIPYFEGMSLWTLACCCLLVMFGWSGGPAGIFFAGPKGYQENGDSHGDPYFEGMSLRTLACYCLLVMFS